MKSCALAHLTPDTAASISGGGSSLGPSPGDQRPCAIHQGIKGVANRQQDLLVEPQRLLLNTDGSVAIPLPTWEAQRATRACSVPAARDPKHQHQNQDAYDYGLIPPELPGTIPGLAIEAKSAINCGGILPDMCHGIAALAGFWCALVGCLSTCRKPLWLAGIARLPFKADVHQLPDMRGVGTNAGFIKCTSRPRGIRSRVEGDRAAPSFAGHDSAAD
mmetsp:Transcript_69883/g.166770  ORF Transcript_69883/g.166770 Transcript_69883/m.166770 type:complete len:218 (-) Transcript_69883:22-675(-)